MKGPLDIHAIFAAVAGREMQPQDAAECRRLLAQAPEGLRESPAYIHSLIISYYQADQLRDTVAGASSQILDDVHRLSEHAVSRIVVDAVRRIQKASPAAAIASYRALKVLICVFGLAILVASATLYAYMVAGWFVPNWYRGQLSAKIAFAEAIERHIPGPKIDWLAADGQADPRLVALVAHAHLQNSAQDPSKQLAEVRACLAPGMVKLRQRGKTICRFKVTS